MGSLPNPQYIFFIYRLYEEEEDTKLQITKLREEDRETKYKIHNTTYEYDVFCNFIFRLHRS